MPLPSSGTLSLNQIHIEVGGSSGSQCSLGDSDISSLIGYGTSQQKSISNYYGASAGPTLQYTSYGTTYRPPVTGKVPAPASLLFNNSAADSILANTFTSSPNAQIFMNELGFYHSGTQGQYGSATWSGVGFSMVDKASGIYIASNTTDFRRGHGTSSGQHYFKIYYGSTLVGQTTQNYDENSGFGIFAGNPSGSMQLTSRTNAGSWRIEMYM